MPFLFSFDLGPVHWVGLSTEYYGYYDTVGKGPLLTQYSWLQKDLAIRVGHNDLPGLESPFIQYGVDLGFWGHQHFYERFFPVANKKYWDSGCHTPNTPFDKTPVPFSAKRLNQYGYTILNISNGTHIHIEQISIDKDDAVVDHFWLTKDAGFVATEEMRLRNPGTNFPSVQQPLPFQDNAIPAPGIHNLPR
ncbi:hypothetical protein TELCIR_07397 [Teladorsagia circumcincta]|uniref:Purple acid phosphatase C-terminal domain-containing protein n=1 Tax=Teladorsagia circumcincta TaxID=45464 RepID=A0A2G9ULX8_TELCI|nr:hypothetical protein TELCIR_07397 [Teladorsagia circumcincta]